MILVDNGSYNFDKIYAKYQGIDKIHIIHNDKNEGIAKALNQIMLEAENIGYKWVITLDDDSIASEGMVRNLLSYIYLENVAIIAPRIFDRNLPHYRQDIYDKNNKYEIKDEVISSGSLTNIEAIKKIGMFDENLFIDLVDIDACMRLRILGYTIVQINNAIMIHELGKFTKFYILPKIGKLLNIDFFKRPKYTTNHSDFRKYYIVRNSIYFLKKYKNNISNPKKYFSFKLIMIWIIAENFSLKSLKAIIKGFIDGQKMI